MKIKLIIILLFLPFMMFSHKIGEVEITQNNNQLHFRIRIYHFDDMTNLGYTTNISHDTININTCQYLLDATMPSYIDYNFDVNVRNNVNYTVVINAFASSSSKNCDYNSLSDQVTLNLTTPLTSPIVLGVKDSLQDTFSIYPNPVKNNMLFIKPKNEDVYAIKITDITGKVIKNMNKLIGDQSILLHQAKGLYFAHIRQGDKEKIIKIIVE